MHARSQQPHQRHRDGQSDNNSTISYRERVVRGGIHLDPAEGVIPVCYPLSTRDSCVFPVIALGMILELFVGAQFIQAGAQCYSVNCPVFRFGSEKRYRRENSN
jgi:hypothetical protein